ncbi:hypothetical protein C2E23DRAFT_815767 [Lenzites betulinus]|nr:hypothetical protein C2E23DRAFT_815767 [Lenzites betulinus]
MQGVSLTYVAIIHLIRGVSSSCTTVFYVVVLERHHVRDSRNKRPTIGSVSGLGAHDPREYEADRRPSRVALHVWEITDCCCFQVC